MYVLKKKLTEAFLAVVPIVLIVLVLNFTISPIDDTQIFRFITGSLFIALGLALFLLGVEVGVAPIGQHMGSAVAKSNKVWVVAVAGLVLGLLISIAEPDLHILAGQVDAITLGAIFKWDIVLVVSCGIAAMLAAGLLRIVYNISLSAILIAMYTIILVLSFFTSPEFLAIAFDASGSTTGALTVPFILSLALGVSSLKKDSQASEKDSFGLVGVTSTGAIITVMLMSLLTGTEEVAGTLDIGKSAPAGVIAPFMEKLPWIAGEIALALMPILLVFLIFQKAVFKVSKNQFRRIIVGLVYSFLGLTLLLTGVNAGFMEVGSMVGYTIAALDNKVLLVSVGFLLGVVTVLAEPAVHALTLQIEEVTSGYVKRRIVLMALSLGVGVSIALSMLRIILPSLELWHFLLPGYIISAGLMLFVPKLFVGIAFDSGGVASGPMTATFVLAFAQGAAGGTQGADVMIDGFGIIAMVAMTPLITLQILGLIYKFKSQKEGID